MAQRSRPMIDSAVVERAVAELGDVLDIDSLSNVDRLFAIDLLNDYGKWCGIAQAAWVSIETDGLTYRRSSGAKGNNHYTMVKSEAIDIFKNASASKSALAARISKFVKSGAAVTEAADDGFEDFVSGE